MLEQTQRETRAPENDVFRAVNEQIVELTDGFAAQPSHLEVVCECSRAACVDTIRVGTDAFGEIKRGGGTFVVLPGHEDETVEQILKREDAYFLVWKAVVSSAPTPPRVA
jgi:hypothetical protein